MKKTESLQTIGQLARRMGINTQTIRYYEREGLLPVPRRSAGSDYRLYDESAEATLRFIRQAQAAGFTLRQIRELLPANSRSRRTCGEVQALIERRLEEIAIKQRELRAFEQALRTLARECQTRPPRSRCPALVQLASRVETSQG